ncbi:fumarate hydratase C (fragment) [Bartonella tribocorum CIP 105476]|uniref:Fumarate hydratase C n=1 Tax=Bartonella tribocorum (strain DSM 28219 / CCUG 45778 / CIP 105476 / IBS 506) TaxID=382640 RepID=A9IY16_BART1
MFILNAYPVLALDPKEEEFLEQNTTPRKVLTLPLLKTIRTLIMHCIQELRANRVHIHALMERSPM